MGDRVTVLFIAACTLVTALLVYSVPARAQNELYDIGQTVTIEGDVAGFVVGDEYATVSMFPVGEPKNSRTMWVVDWRGGTSLSGQGITADWLKSGDRVVVTGHPYRIAGRRQLLLETITRGFDGRKWARGQAASTSSASQGSDAGGSPGAQHSDPRLAALEPSVRGMVVKELDVARANCETNVTMNNLYDCDCCVREVLAARLKAGTSTQDTGGTLVFRHAVRPQLDACVSTSKIEKYGARMAEQIGRPELATCMGRELAVRFRQRPVPNDAYVQGILRDLALSGVCQSGQGTAAKPTPPSTATSAAPTAPSPAAAEESRPGAGSSGAGNTQASVAAPSAQADAGAQAATSAPAQSATTAASDSEAVASTAGNAQASSSTALGTPAAEVRPPTTTTPSAQTTPEQTETLAERQKAINEDVSAKTASVVADLKKKADTQLAQAGAAAQAAAPAAAQSQAAQTLSADAPAGPAWEPCKSELRSGASQTAVPVEFVNSSQQPRKLIWFDFAGAKIVAGTLQPGQRAPMQTYMTHAWMIADGSDRCMGTLVISKAGSIEIR